MAVLRTALLAVPLAGGAVLVASVVARAQQVEGLYVGGAAGYNILQDVTAAVEAMPGRAVVGGGNAGAGVAASAPMHVTWGGGYMLSGSIGWGFGNGIRMEVEGSYRSNQQSRSGSSGGGRQSQFGVMGNAFYDFDLGLGFLTPYVGVGAGYQAVTWNRVAGQAIGIDLGSSPTSISIDQTLGGFAYQVIAGVAFPIDAVPGLALTAEYRFLNLVGTRAYRASGATSGVSGGFPNNTTRARVNSDASHSLLLGLRYAFDAPDSAPVERPPPVPPVAVEVPAPATPTPSRTYLVFFDWNSAELTPRAREIIADAVRNSTRAATTTRIEVTGHADRTGGAQANQVLSLRRAQVVAAELERNGVPKAVINIRAAGDKRPLVPTAAGVSQPENRRVEIVYR